MIGLLDLAAALGTRDPALTRMRLVEARDHGHEGEVGELLLMALFVTGFPAGLEAAGMWAGIRSEPPAGEKESEIDYETRGRESCAAVYGNQFQGLLEGLGDLHPDLPGLVVGVGYGRMMSRPALPLQARELCLVAMLIPWRAETQLYSHLRGALLVGASDAEVEKAIAAGVAAARSTGAHEASIERAEVMWDRVRGRHRTRPEKET